MRVFLGACGEVVTTYSKGRVYIDEEGMIALYCGKTPDGLSVFYPLGSCLIEEKEGFWCLRFGEMQLNAIVPYVKRILSSHKIESFLVVSELRVIGLLPRVDFTKKILDWLDEHYGEDGVPEFE